jgi:hypothetical protein
MRSGIINNNMKRILWNYKNQVRIPATYKQFLWDYPGKTAPLEMLVLRVLTYGSFRDLQWLYNKYGEQTYALAFKYPNIKRGMRFWLRKWHDDPA